MSLPNFGRRTGRELTSESSAMRVATAGRPAPLRDGGRGSFQCLRSASIARLARPAMPAGFATVRRPSSLQRNPVTDRQTANALAGMKLSARCCGRLQSSGGVSPTTWRNVFVVRRTDGPVRTQSVDAGCGLAAAEAARDVTAERAGTTCALVGLLVRFP